MTKTRKLTTLAMLAALSVVLVAIIHIPIFPAAPFLQYDPADIPILIATFSFGPLAGLMVTAVVSVIQAFLVSGDGVYGMLMHFLATGAYVLVAGFIYRRKKTRTTGAVSLACGAATMVIVMIGLNLLITPFFTGGSVEDVKELLVPVIIPFNLIKAGINGLVTFLVYKPISNFVKHPSEKKEAKSAKNKV